jgi:hypothetical protein
MLHDFSFIYEKQNLLMSFTTKFLIMGSNVVEWQLILVVLDN